MAVSVRIEDEAFSDRRYNVLARILGLPDADCARGKMAAVWRQCTQQQTHILSGEMVREVLGENGPDALIISQLGEVVEGGIRICGTRGRIEWLARLRKNGKKGGRPRKPNENHMVSLGDDLGKLGANPPAPAPAPVTTKDKKKVASQGDVALTTFLIVRIIKNNPASGLTKLTPTEKTEKLNSWAEHVRKLRELDGHSEAEIKAVIEWCQADSFWRGNILSTKTLREQWEKLTAQMAAKGALKSVTKQAALKLVVDDDNPTVLADGTLARGAS